MRRIALLALLFVLALPATALAGGSSTCQAYNPQLCSTVSSKSTTHYVGTTSSSAKTLPFTGLDAVLLVAGGATLLGAGLAVRMASRRLS